jgi:hypothetical protein
VSVSILTVNGTAYNQAQRKTASLLVDAWGWDVDSDYFLEFHEVVGGPQPQFKGPYAVSMTFGTSSPPTVFNGAIVSCSPSFGTAGRTWGYRCLGLKYLANWIAITAIDGSGLIRFNVNPAQDIADYVPSLSGQTVGQIISYCLSQHSSQLAAIGVFTDSTTASQLAALTLVPNIEVDVSGERLWNAMEAVLQQWARNIRLIILPSGLVRVIDITVGTAVTLNICVDPIDPPLLSSNWTNCAPRVQVRGQGQIEGGYVQTIPISGVQTLTPAWSNANALAWNYAAFTDPKGGVDNGTVTSVTSATTLNVTSATAGFSVGANYWPGIQAWIYPINTAGTGLTFTEARQITANTASSGGAYTVTVAYALTNASYTNYQIIGTNVPLASGGLSEVYRVYNVTDPGNQIAHHMVRQFPVPYPFVIPGATYAQLVNFPSCYVEYQQTVAGSTVITGGSPPFIVDPVKGQIVFTRPVVELGNTIAVLNAGGSGVAVPYNVYVLVPYSRGAMHTTYPADIGGVPQYSGTSYSVGGLQRTQTVDVPSWTYFANSPVLNNMAQMLQQSVRDTIVEGSIHYRGNATTFQSPTGGATPGYLISISSTYYTTGYETANLPLRAATYRYLNQGGQGTLYTTDLRVSTRREPRTGESYYAHLSVLGTGGFTPAAGVFGGWGPMQFTQEALETQQYISEAAEGRATRYAEIPEMYLPIDETTGRYRKQQREKLRSPGMDSGVLAGESLIDLDAAESQRRTEARRRQRMAQTMGAAGGLSGPPAAAFAEPPQRTAAQADWEESQRRVMARRERRQRATAGYGEIGRAAAGESFAQGRPFDAPLDIGGGG